MCIDWCDVGSMAKPWSQTGGIAPRRERAVHTSVITSTKALLYQIYLIPVVPKPVVKTMMTAVSDIILGS